jgi:protein-disulfide isomerase
MNKIKTLLAGIMALTLSAGVVTAADSLSPAQQDAVKEIVKSYLKENPEVVIDAIQTWQEKQVSLKAEQQKKTIAMLNASLKEDTGTPFLGNEKAQTMVVEFSDYNCPYCKRAYPGIKALLAADGDLKIVMMELPVLGPMSEFAAKAALASHMQGKYAAFHEGMMGTSARLNQEGILAVAIKAGLDMDKLKQDMNSPEVAGELESNAMMAQLLGISGTPAFVVGDQLVPGAIGKDKLKALVDKSRER